MTMQELLEQFETQRQEREKERQERELERERERQERLKLLEQLARAQSESELKSHAHDVEGVTQSFKALGLGRGAHWLVPLSTPHAYPQATSMFCQIGDRCPPTKSARLSPRSSNATLFWPTWAWRT
jgi:hypothetical protein